MILDTFERPGVDAPPSADWSPLGFDPAMELTFLPIQLAGDGHTATASAPAATDQCGCFWNRDAFVGDVDVWVTVDRVGEPPSSNEGLGLVACYGGPGVGYRLTWWWNSPGTTDACLTLIRDGAWDPTPYPPLQLADGDGLALRVLASEGRVEALHRPPGGAWTVVGSWLDPLGPPDGDFVGLVIGESLHVEGFAAGRLDQAPAYIGAVRIDGVSADLDRVLASVSIRHGRDDVDGAIQSSTATLRLRRLSRSELRAWQAGGFLEVFDDTGAQLFSGQISDAELAVDDAVSDAVLTVIAASTLADAGRRPVAGHAWPAESWGARMQRILDEAGLAGAVQPPSPDVPLAATKPADPETGAYAQTNALDALDEARDYVGATVFDEPDGSVIVQAFGARGDLAPMLTLDPADVLYAPTWGQTLDIVNRVVLGYGYGDGTVTVDDVASQERYGVRWTGLFDSGLADAATARARAQLWLDRLSAPRWKLPALTLLRPYQLSIGRVLELGSLPPSAPVSAWTPIVEGWTDVFEGPDWTQEVILSDPMLSGLALPWQDLPPDLTWANVDPAARWTDAFSLGNLVPEGAR